MFSDILGRSPRWQAAALEAVGRERKGADGTWVAWAETGQTERLTRALMRTVTEL